MGDLLASMVFAGQMYSAEMRDGIRSPGTVVWVVVSHHLGTGNQTQVLLKNINCS